MPQSTPTSNFNVQDFYSTTLSSAITASDTTIPLVAAPTPTEGFLVIEPDSSTNREIIMYTSVSGSSVVCGSTSDRGIGGTTARAHSSGVTVKMNTVSDMFKALKSGAGMGSTFTPPTGSLTSKALTNPYKFSVYLSADQSLSAGVAAKVRFDTKVIDTGSNFDNSTNYRFTAPIAGFYWVAGQVSIGSAGLSSGVYATADLYKNGSVFKSGLSIAGSGDSAILPRINISTLVQLAANDYLEMYGITGDSGRGIVGSQALTYFSGFLISAT